MLKIISVLLRIKLFLKFRTASCQKAAINTKKSAMLVYKAIFSTAVMPGEKKLKKYKDKKNKITLSRMRLYFFIIFSPKFRKIKL